MATEVTELIATPLIIGPVFVLFIIFPFNPLPEKLAPALVISNSDWILYYCLPMELGQYGFYMPMYYVFLASILEKGSDISEIRQR
jgi:hypothetical protein